MIDFCRFGLPSTIKVNGEDWLAVYFIRKDEQDRHWYLACRSDASVPAPVSLVVEDKS